MSTAGNFCCTARRKRIRIKWKMPQRKEAAVAAQSLKKAARLRDKERDLRQKWKSRNGWMGRINLACRKQPTIRSMWLHLDRNSGATFGRGI